MAIIMDGKALAAKMQDHLHEKVERLKEKRSEERREGKSV